MSCHFERTPGGGVMFWCGPGIRKQRGKVKEYEVADVLAENERLRRRLARVLSLTTGIKVWRRASGFVIREDRRQPRGRVWSKWFASEPRR
jgi:hypothetical protein